MRVPKIPLIAFCLIVAGSFGSGSAFAQANNSDKPIDFKPLIPPVLPPLPPNSQLNSGSVGGTQTPYTTAPLYDTNPSQPAPGLRFTIPSR